MLSGLRLALGQRQAQVALVARQRGADLLRPNVQRRAQGRGPFGGRGFGAIAWSLGWSRSRCASRSGFVRPAGAGCAGDAVWRRAIAQATTRRGQGSDRSGQNSVFHRSDRRGFGRSHVRGQGRAASAAAGSGHAPPRRPGIVGQRRIVGRFRQRQARPARAAARSARDRHTPSAGRPGAPDRGIQALLLRKVAQPPDRRYAVALLAHRIAQTQQHAAAAAERDAGALGLAHHHAIAPSPAESCRRATPAAGAQCRPTAGTSPCPGRSSNQIAISASPTAERHRQAQRVRHLARHHHRPPGVVLPAGACAAG